MATFTRADDLRGAEFLDADLRGARLIGADIDAPWLPGRADRRAGDSEGLQAAWGMLERTWAATLERVVAMPATILEEEWEHHRYAVRDLDAIAAKSDA